MRKRTKSIPVNTMTDNFGGDISIEKISVINLRALEKASENSFEDAQQSHRHDRHSFFLLESGTVSIEIDFQKYKIMPSSVIYMHPDQVHRMIAFENVTVSSWAINNENLNPEYLKLLEDITPAKPLALDEETFSIISEAVSLGIKFSERKNDKLYHSLLKDSCNALVALVVSQYLEQSKSNDRLSRFEIITKAFREMLERDFITAKKPTEYAQTLNISTSYLNECVKNTTGYSVSHLIQQRVILEAKRLLYYSDKSVKEIAAELGYDDYPYFSRLFTKVTEMTALAFRNKNRD
ncbi:AraC family transcriptional regulator [Dyadobacter frigoris]|uniref:Helix-turn-helix domain-containing protein n=1 Tax=Dyadobacter frigoris TaxID=2576211 RepID=A0A4U6CSG0_9BACT|nr:helix-turn-helix domain-containing protein [Dyadobacter frigoris]TKT87529.1 helix-turn-helix domain-containing protein [Dyadobacter frigoris]GLU52212.1 AraC family transcriptional regulator [Dyadobacter frigoris]